MTSYPCNKYEQITPSYRLSVKQIIKFLKYKTMLKKACNVNFYRIFISSISLLLEVAGSDLAQTLHNPPEVVWHPLYL